MKPQIIQSHREKLVIPATSDECYMTQPNPDIHCLETQKILIAGTSRLREGYSASRFPSYYNLILYTHEGSGCIDYGEQQLHTKAGDVLLAPCGQTFSYYPENDLWNCSWAHLINSPEWSPAFPTKLEVHLAHWGDQIKQLIQQYITEANTRRSDSLIPLRHLSELLVYYIRRELSVSTPEQVANRKRLEELWNIVHADLKQPWNIDRLSQITGMSRTSLHGLCKKMYQVPPMQMVIQMRMERAAELLSGTDYKLEMIAEQVGYDSAFTFSRAFKNYMNVAPKTYRNRFHE